MKKVLNYVNKDGTINTSDVIAGGISKFDYYRFLKENNYQKVAPGVYASEDAWLDELLLLNIRCPKGVISHDEALYYYGLIDHEPQSTTFTIYSGYNVSRLKSKGYKAFYVKKELLDIGKMKVIDFYGNEINMYDLERTICDLVRNRNDFEIQDYNNALKSYVKRKDKNITKLFEYATLFKIENVLRKYMEVLL